MLRTVSVVATLLFVVVQNCCVETHEMYVSMVPNGANVPGVEALGHTNPHGDGALNSFGEDFAAALYVWTRELCTTDSDGDGQTNGQELGDPCCEWDLLGANALWTEGISHPENASDTSDESLWATTECNSSSASTSAAEELTSSGSSASLPGSTSHAALHTDVMAAAVVSASLVLLLAV